MVDIEERSLRTLEQDLLLRLHRLVEQGHRIGDQRSEDLGSREVVGEDLLTVERLTAESADERVVLLEPEREFFTEDFGLGQIGHAETGAGDLVTVSRADAALGGADLVLALECLAEAVEFPVPRHHEMGAVADEEVLGVHLDPAIGEPLDLGNQSNGVDDHAVADDAKLALAENAGRDQVEDILLVAVDNGVAGVIAPLATDDDVDLAGQHVDDFAFAFIPPLGADENGVCHSVFSVNAKKPDSVSG